MSAEIVGIEKINKYINNFDFKKIKLTRGAETLYIKSIKDEATQADLIEDFNEWVDDFIEPSNFRDYKLELFGTYSADKNAKLSPIVKVVVAFNHKAAAPTFLGDNKKENYTSSMDVERYIAVATENATLKAQLERMEEKMDELLMEDEEEEVGQLAAPSFTEAINTTLIGKLDTIVDVVLGMLAKPNAPVQSYAINGIQETDDLLIEFRKVHPEIDHDIALFYKLAITQPKIFKMVIGQLRDMV
jgi:hypothetical protein